MVNFGSNQSIFFFFTTTKTQPQERSQRFCVSTALSMSTYLVDNKELATFLVLKGKKKKNL